MTTEPKLLTEADIDRFRTMSQEAVTAELRERGLIAEEPVDRLMKKAVELVGLWLPDETELRHEAIDLALAALRRGMELAPRKELTREMVRGIVKVALHETGAVVEYDDFLPGSPVGPAREADDFVTHLHAAIQEALQ